MSSRRRIAPKTQIITSDRVIFDGITVVVAVSSAASKLAFCGIIIITYQAAVLLRSSLAHRVNFDFYKVDLKKNSTEPNQVHFPTFCNEKNTTDRGIKMISTSRVKETYS